MKDFIELIKNNAKNYPDRIAVIEGDSQINYGDFFNLVTSISHQLVLKDSNPKIVIDLKQGVEAYALIVAILNVGGTYCPLNPDAPIEKKMQIVNEFAPNLIITETIEKASAFNSDKAIAISEILNSKNHSEKEYNYNGEDIVYVIYTSGSTGMPKGVKVCRKALNKFLEWSIPTYAANEQDIWAQFSYLSFDLSIVDIFTCFCSGATLLAMADRTSKWVPSSAIEAKKITIWHSVPSTVEFMIEKQKTKSIDFSSLRLMSFCGEPLRKHYLDFLFEGNPNLSIFNTYGPTEGTLFCTWKKFEKENYSNYYNPTMSIGDPIPGWNIELNQVDDSDIYEIIIHGDYIGKGYLGEVLDSKFKNIQVGDTTVNAFETGDLVTKKEENLYFSSRKDRQIKLKGFRIEPDEIDLRITESINKPSVTILHENALYSFIETAEAFSETELRDALSKKLEPYKMPRTFISVEKFPRSPNAKINYSELPNLIK
jgi:D-alanine--poly(phosphoribitol) ligase subunit 1